MLFLNRTNWSSMYQILSVFTVIFHEVITVSIVLAQQITTKTDLRCHDFGEKSCVLLLTILLHTFLHIIDNLFICEKYLGLYSSSVSYIQFGIIHN